VRLLHADSLDVRHLSSLCHAIITLFADVSAANVVNGNGWAALAAKEFGIAMQVIALPKEVINRRVQREI
jgi:hypothetical protein